MLFTKTHLCSKAQCVGHGFFLFNTEDNHNTTETFIVEDLVIVYEGLLLGENDDPNPRGG